MWLLRENSKSAIFTDSGAQFLVIRLITFVSNQARWLLSAYSLIQSSPDGFEATAWSRRRKNKWMFLFAEGKTLSVSHHVWHKCTAERLHGPTQRFLTTGQWPVETRERTPAPVWQSLSPRREAGGTGKVLQDGGTTSRTNLSGLQLTTIFIAVWSVRCKEMVKMSISVCKSPKCFVHNPKIIGLLTEKTEETWNYPHFRSWNQNLRERKWLKLMNRLSK